MARFEDTVLKTVLTSNTIYKFRCFPKPPSGSIIHWKGSQNSPKAIILMVTGYKERIQIKISQGKRLIQGSAWGWFQIQSFQDALLSWHQHGMLLICDNMVLPAREAHCTSISVQSFYWSFIT